MTMYSGQTTQLLQGVSQQHPKDRAEGQIGAQVNCISDVVEGLRRRPSVIALSDLSGIATGFTLDDDTAIYSYSRGDGTEEYIILVDTSGNIKIYDAFTGAAKTVTNNNATYLATSSPRSDLRFHTIGDTTFVLNTTQTIAMDATTTSDAQVGTALVYTIKASYGKVYKIIVEGTVYASIQTPSQVTISSTVQDKTAGLSTNQVMDSLVNGTARGGWTITTYLNSGAFATAGYSWELQDDVCYVARDNGTDFDITVTDGNNNNDLRHVKNAVQAFERLPKYAPDGYKLEVTGLGDEKIDNYWVKWVSENTDVARWAGSGYWQECEAPDIDIDLDEDTMPTQIVREADGSFTNDVAAWVSRAAGDDETNPQPSFVGSTGTDIGSYQNRLFILTGENIVMTQAFDQLNWWAASVAAPSDDDPIDSASSDNQVTDLLHSTVYNGALVLFSNNAQFIHEKDTVATPATFAVSADSKFNVSPNVKPVTTGSYIVFPTDFGNYTNVWEYNINTLTGAPQCESTTKHVPRYLDGAPVQMEANTTTDYVFVRTDADDTAIFVYQFYSKDEKRAQLAWHKWTFDSCDKIYNMTLLNQRLFLVTERDSTVYLEYIDLSLPLSEGSDFEIFLDHCYSDQVTSGSYSIGGKNYTARVPLQETNITTFVQGTDGSNTGMRILSYTIDSGYVYCNMPANSYVLQGYPFWSTGTLTNPYIRDVQGRPYTKKTIMEEISVNVQKTGYLTMEVEHGAGATYTQDFNGILINHWQYKIGQASELDTDIYLPIRDYRELVTVNFKSNHHLGFALMSMDWRCRMTSRGRRSQ